MSRERENKKREEIKSNRSPRALITFRRSKKRVRTFRAFRDVWVVLRHGGGAFFFVRVLPFLCNKERESVSMSALPKAQTSRFEREIRRERARERDDDDDVSSLLCFCTHEKTRDPKRSPKRKKTKKKEIVFLTDIYYVMCVRIKEWGKSALDLCSPTRERKQI